MCMQKTTYLVKVFVTHGLKHQCQEFGHNFVDKEKSLQFLGLVWSDQTQQDLDAAVYLRSWKTKTLEGLRPLRWNYDISCNIDMVMEIGCL